MGKINYRALAVEFISACRAHGHEPRVSNGSFGIRLGVLAPTAPPEGSFALGFDDRPFAVLRDEPDYLRHLSAATLAHVGNRQEGRDDE